MDGPRHASAIGRGLGLVGRGRDYSWVTIKGESETAQLILRDLVNATMGFEQLATLTATGNPCMEYMEAVFRAIQDRLQVHYSLTATVV